MGLLGLRVRLRLDVNGAWNEVAVRWPLVNKAV
jgi:hypothetical protein